MGKETISRTTFAKGVTAGVIVAASLGILSIGDYSIKEIPVASEGNGSYTPGTYTASAAGISSDVTVTCTFNETTITSIEADVSGETAGIGAEIGDTMVGKVLSEQTAEVDAESGATITSEAFKAAVADCIAQASGETVAAAETEAEAAETEAGSEAEEASEAAETEAVEESAADTAASAGGSYVAGTYTASAAGISSDVTVTCTFDGTSITAIEADVSGETAGIGAEIGDTMVEKVLAAQSADVDAESGATVTSEAFKAAVADCIAQASGGAAESTQAEEASEAVETETEAATEAAETETEEVTEAAETETEEVTEAAETETEEITEVAETETEATDADSSATETETESELTDADSSATETEFETELINPLYIEGEYTATADGYDSEILVTVTVDANSILSIEADVSGEPDNYGGLTDETLEKLILAAQSADVDGVSGATVTSDAIKAAAADCLEQAAAPAEDETEAGTSYKPGTYTASAAGISSDVTVTCTFDETSITSIEADVSGETAGIGAAIGDDMIDAVLAAQSADVDAVSGATITSEAFMTAVADCMEQAKAE
jgi:uncharacterized protein with FMN-binding domain